MTTSGRSASALRSSSSASPAWSTTSRPASVRRRATPSRSRNVVLGDQYPQRRVRVTPAHRCSCPVQEGPQDGVSELSLGNEASCAGPNRRDPIGGVGIRGDQDDGDRRREREQALGQVEPVPMGRAMSATTASGWRSAAAARARSTVSASPTTSVDPDRAGVGTPAHGTVRRRRRRAPCAPRRHPGSRHPTGEVRAGPTSSSDQHDHHVRLAGSHPHPRPETMPVTGHDDEGRTQWKRRPTELRATFRPSCPEVPSTPGRADWCRNGTGR